MEFKNIRDTREPMMFPLSKLLLCIAQDEHTKKETLKLVKPLLEQVKMFFEVYSWLAETSYKTYYQNLNYRCQQIDAFLT